MTTPGNIHPANESSPRFTPYYRQMRLIYSDHYTRYFPAILVLGGVAIIGSVLRSLATGWLPLYTLHIFFYLVLFGVKFIDKNELFLSGWIFQLFFGINGAVVLYNTGMASLGAAFFLVSALSVALFFGTRAGLITGFLYVTLFAVIGAGVTRGFIPARPAIGEYVVSYKAWLAQGTAFLFLTVYTVIIISVVQRYLFGLVDTIRESEQRYRLLIENLPSVVWVTDKEGTTDYISQNVDKVYGFTAEEILAGGEEFWLGRIHPDDAGTVRMEFDALFSDGKPFNVEYRIQHKNGDYLWVHDQANITDTIDGKKKAYGVFSNITLRRQVEERLQQSELQYRSLFEAANDAIFLMDAEAFIDCNLRALSMFGCSREQIVGHRPAEFSPAVQPDGEESIAKAMKKITAAMEGEPQRFEWLHCRGDRSVFDAEVSLNRLDIGERVLLLAIVRDVTERKESERKIRENEKRHRFISENIEDVIWAWSFTTNKFTYVTPSILRQRGYTVEEVLHQTMADALTPESLERVTRQITDNIALRLRENRFDLSKTISVVDQKCKDGSVMPVEVATTIVFNEQEQPVEIIGISRDITERLKAEAALRKSEAFRKRVFDTSRLPMVVMDYATHQVIDCNPASAIIYGYGSRDEVLRKTPVDVSAEFQYDGTPSSEKAAYYIDKAKSEGAVVFEWQHRRPDGELWDAEVHLMSFTSEGRELLQFSLLDITERKRVEQALREEKRFSDAIINTLPGTFFLYEDGLRLVRWNKNFEKVNRGIAGEMRNLNPADPFDEPEKKRIVLDAVEKVMIEGEGKLEIERVAKDGSHRTFLYSAVRIESNGKRYLLGMGQDITEMKKALAAIRESEERFRQIAENIEEVFFLLDKATRSVLYVSPAIENIFGVPVSRIAGTPFILAETLHPDDRATSQFADFSLRYNRAISEEFRIVRADGAARWLRLRSFLIHDEHGEVYRVAGVVADITEQKNAQEATRLHQQQLIQADKMASVGMMVSGVAHEINNPNNLIMLNADVMKTFWVPMRETIESVVAGREGVLLAGIPAPRALGKFETLIDGVAGGAVRIKTIVQNLKDFARIDSADQVESVSLNNVINSAMSIIHPIVEKATKQFTIEVQPDLPDICGSFQKLEQVVINLINNACQALEGNGKRVWVRTYYATDLKQVVAEVQDEGCGIPPENLTKIMDPFFTTKRDSGGTGLGLSVSYGIIKDHGGEMEFESTEGVGTTVQIRLPVVAGRAPGINL